MRFRALPLVLAAAGALLVLVGLFAGVFARTGGAARFSGRTVFGAFGVVGGVVLLLVSLPMLFGDRKAADLASAPAYGLVFPKGVLLNEVKSRSVAGAGAFLLRAYGTDEPQDQIIAFFDTTLRDLGYEAVPSRPDPGGDTIRRWRLGEVTFSIALSGLPERVGARTYVTGYEHILYARISNERS